MRPEAIMQSDLLDIIFDNRNKDYGAYALRRNYNQRLLQAMGGTVLVTGLIILLMQVKPVPAKILPGIVPDIKVTEVYIAPIQNRTPPGQRVARGRKAYNPTVIERDTETTVPPVDVLNSHGPAANGDPGEPGDGNGGAPGTGGTGTSTPINPEPVVAEPNEAPSILMHAEVMPVFNGDLVRFLLRHLKQPDDLEEGERVMIMARFVVTKEGDIEGVEIVRPGRADLDREVIRVIKKMPRWKPGMQNGRAVPVYFNLPVTFVSNG